MKIRYALSAMAIVATFTGQQAAAQSAPASGAKSDPKASAAQARETNESDVVVTASRRDSELQDTPLPVTAITGKQLEARGLLSISAAATLIPGVSLLNSEPGTNEITIRGVGTSTSTATQTDVIQNSTTSVYLDQLPVTSTIQKTPDYRFVDLQRIEVLKGPQGTLYGQSSLGGVVRYIANKPDSTKTYGGINSYVSGTENGGVNYGGDGFLNVPVTETLALRFAGYGYRNSGFIDVVGTSRVRDANVENTYGGRAALRWKPTDRLTIDVTGLYHSVDLGSNQLISSTYTPGLTTRRGFPVDLRPLSLDRLETEHLQPSFERAWLVTGDIRYAFDGFDANVIVGQKNVFSRSRFEAVELVGRTESYSNNTTTGDNSTTTVEFRLSSNWEDKFIDWNVGLYYENSGGTIITRAVQSGITFDLLDGAFEPFFRLLIRPGDVTLDSGRQLNYREVAGFGEVTFNLTKRLKLTGGFRRSNVDNNYRWVRAAGTLDGLIGRTALLNVNQAQRESINTYKGNIYYRLNPSVLFYGQVATGYRPGGFNPGNAQARPTIPDTNYRSDDLINYEIGAKTQAFNNRLIFNLAAYRIDWSNIQLSAVQLVSPFPAAVINAGTARIYGIEAEASFKASRNLTVSANYAFTDATLVRASTSPIPGFSNPPGRPGDSLPGTPKHAFSFLGDWNSQLTNDIKLIANITYRYIGDRPAAIGNPFPLAEYHMVDLRAGFQFKNGFALTAFADNVTNTVAATQRVDAVLTSGQPFQYFNVTRPRTVGLRGSFNF
ncbi:MAG: TonB-dependent receptor [Sphingomonas sp.]|nr:TonB-dependent receptor [Sphingomonas sp.]